VAERRGLTVTSGRGAEITYYVYGPEEFGVRALVDVTSKRVLHVERVPDGRVPLATEEVAEARRLALADSGVTRALGRNREGIQIDWLGLHSDNREDACSHNRCVQLLFRRGDRYLMDPQVVVNLSTRTVQLTRSQQ